MLWMHENQSVAQLKGGTVASFLIWSCPLHARNSILPEGDTDHSSSQTNVLFELKIKWKHREEA